MNQRYQIGLSVISIVIIVGLAYAFWPTPSEAPSISAPVTATPTPLIVASSSPIESALVTYSDQGFSPQVIEITQGGSVTFKNESSRDVWVASNDHPTHLLYPEFDAKKGYTPGSEYTFTFDKVGTWKYHDHLKASLGGTVIVK